MRELGVDSAREDQVAESLGAAPAATPGVERMRGLASAVGNRAFQRVVQRQVRHMARGPTLARLRGRAPFARVLQLHAQWADVVARLVTDLEAVADPPEPLTRHIALLQAERNMARERRDGAAGVVEAWVAGEEYDRPEFHVDALNYVENDRPALQSIRRIEEQLERQIAMAEIVRPRALEFVRHTDPLGADAQAFVREMFSTVAGYYLELVERPHGEIFERLGFLESYYRDPAVVEGYAIATHVRAQIEPLYRTLRQASSQGEGLVLRDTLAEDARPFGDDRIEPFEREHGVSGRRLAGLMHAYNQLLALRAAAAPLGEPPRSLREVGVVPSPERSQALAGTLFSVQVRTALLMLWQPITPLRDLVYSHDAIGKTLNPFVSDADTDRARWLRELTALEVELWDEFGRRDHPGIAAKIQAWERRVQRLVDEIPPDARRWHIIRAIAEQIPFIFVVGATVMRVGLWVRALTSSRWLVALAEGATMTAFSAVGSRPGTTGRPTTAVGWAGHFALNVVFAGFVRFLFEGGHAVAQLVRARSALATFGLRIGAPTATLAVVQTGAQSLEAHARGRGGETSFSELLTANLVMHAMGIAVGLASTPGGGTAATDLAAPRPSARDLSTRLRVPEDVARQMLEVAGRMEEFLTRSRAIQEAVRSGRLTRQAFEAHKREGLELADWLEPRLAAIARGGGLGATTPAEVAAAMAVLRARIQGAVYSATPRVTALLPEHVGGLRPVGEGPTWVYDASAPPRQLPALRTGLEQAGHTVRELPSGGWEARDSAGRLAAQVVPVSPALVRALPAPAERAAGPQVGLVGVGDKPANLVAAQISYLATAGLTPQEIGTLLGVMSPGEAASASSWIGVPRLRDVARVGAPAARNLLAAHERVHALFSDEAAMTGLDRLVRTQKRHPTENPLNTTNVLTVLTTPPASRVGPLLRVIGQPGFQDPHGYGKTRLLALADHPAELDFLDRFGIEAFRIVDARGGAGRRLHARLYDESGVRTMGEAEARALVDDLVGATPRQRDEMLGIERPAPRRIYSHGLADETASDWASYLAGAEAFIRGHSELVSPRTEAPYGTDVAAPARAYAHLQQVRDRIVPRWAEYQRKLTYAQKRQILDQLNEAAGVGGLQPGWTNQLVGQVAEALFAPQGTRQFSIPNPLHPAKSGGPGFSRLDGFFGKGVRDGRNPSNRDWLELKSHDLTSEALRSRGEGRAVLLARAHAGEAAEDWHALLAHQETRNDRIVIHYARPPRDAAVRAAMERELFARESPIAAVRYGGEDWIERPAGAGTPTVPQELEAPPTRSLPGVGFP